MRKSGVKETGAECAPLAPAFRHSRFGALRAISAKAPQTGQAREAGLLKHRAVGDIGERGRAEDPVASKTRVSPRMAKRYSCSPSSVFSSSVWFLIS